MEKKYSILIADDERAFSSALADYLGSFDDYEICGIADDGIRAVEMIDEYQPDMVILDLIMPQLDGLGVMEQIQEKKPKKQPQFLFITCFSQPATARQALALGASYYMMKPLSLDTLEKRLRHIRNNKDFDMILPPQLNSLETETTRTILSIGVPAHVKGYQYIREAVLLVCEKASLMVSVTKVLYPQIAEKFNTTPSRVERAIRHAIELAWERNHGERVRQFFNYGNTGRWSKPTNSEFIAMVANYVLMKERTH